MPPPLATPPLQPLQRFSPALFAAITQFVNVRSPKFSTPPPPGRFVADPAVIVRPRNRHRKPLLMVNTLTFFPPLMDTWLPSVVSITVSALIAGSSLAKAIVPTTLEIRMEPPRAALHVRMAWRSDPGPESNRFET